MSGLGAGGTLAGFLVGLIGRSCVYAPSKRGSGKPKVNGEVDVATGLYVMQEGSVMVAYGTRHIAISYAQYKANEYKPTFEKLVTKSPSARISSRFGVKPRSGKGGSCG